MSETNTPRTDAIESLMRAAIHEINHERGIALREGAICGVEQLETELADARAELAVHEDNARQSLEEIEALRANFTEWHRRALAFEDERNQARAELAQVTKERDVAQAFQREAERDAMNHMRTITQMIKDCGEHCAELAAAITFIKELNATKYQHGRQYRSRCGQFLSKHAHPNL